MTSNLLVPRIASRRDGKTISSVIDMDPPEDIGRYFGCMHRHEHGLMLPKDAHPFRHVFEPEPKTATPARTEDYWDIDPENLLAVRHHNYPRRRLYVPNEDDARIFPTIGPRRYTVVAKSDKCISDNSNESRDRNLKEWWSGETYFDLAGRDQGSFELAVAATRKGKPIRNKSEAKKEVKQSKFVTPSQDQKEKPGVMFKPVTRVTYDMKDFLDSCVERYCELAKVDRKTLKPAATPFHEHRTARPIIGEEEKAGRLQPIASRVLMKILFAARMARWDLLRATQSLASRVTKWSPDCDLGLHRLVCYINSSTDVTMSGFIGDSIMDCRLWLFSDSDFAGEYDSKSTTGCSMFLVGPNTYFPLNAFSKKQTSITMSSTESEVVAANQGLRAEGLPCLSLWYFLWRGDAGRKAEPRVEKDESIVARIDPELDEIRYGTTRPDGLTIADINGLSVQLPKSFQIRHMEDNQATITLLLSGQAGVLRHTDRTQRVSFGWLKQQYENGEFRLLNVGTAEQTADVFTKPFTEKSKWVHALRLIGHTSSAHAGCKPVSSKGEVKTTTAAVSDGIKAVEDFAKSALESKKFDFPTFEKLASLIRQHLKSSLSRARPLMTQDNQSSYLVFGAWVHGGLFGVTKKTLSHSWLCKYVNAFVEKSSPKGFTWTSFVFNFNGKARLHTDKYNLKDSYNLTFSFGDYTGGALWIQGASQLGPSAKYIDDKGEEHPGYNCNTYRKFTLLHPQTKHAVQPYTGERHSFIAYSSGGFDKLVKEDLDHLTKCKFRLPKQQQIPRHAMVCCVCSPLDEGGSSTKLSNTKFSRSENVFASIECTNTHPTTHHQSCSLVRMGSEVATCGAAENFAGMEAIYCSKTPATAFDHLTAMAAIVVQDEFVRVNTSEPDRKGVLDAMKQILAAATVHSDYMCFGPSTEQKMLEEAYQGVSTQCAAQIALTNAEADVPNLIQMTYVSDEGLAKLKPTARLSPKKPKVLILVSDSSTALCSCSKKGRLTKGDLTNEVDHVALSCGYLHAYYSMCWGKTLSWLAWQVEEHIKTATEVYPDALIDVVVWWCGNEISGQWGCIPTRIAPGAAYREGAATTEQVAKKIRRAADSLAARKGEPGCNIGFVKVIGKVESVLFQLHNAYDDFNEAMFTEFANRGLQTQSATTCVGSLELYDAFHASENEHNREVFTAFLHATLALSRAEWLAEMMQLAIRPPRRQYPHVEHVDVGNAAATKALRDWNDEKAKIRAAKEGIPIRRAHTQITEEDKAWEQPDVAKAADLTTLPTTPPLDKAIREDVPDFGPTTTVEGIAECINDVVVQDDDGNVSYQPQGDVALVDDGDYDVPIQSSMGRVIEDPTPKKAPSTRKSDQEEDLLRREMYVDHSAPQGVAPSSGSPAQEYYYNGVAHMMLPINPNDIRGSADVKFNHGDLKFLSLLLRGHELEQHGLIFDKGCWTDVDKLLDRFNHCRQRRWGIRQLLRAAKADKKGRIRLLGIDVPMKETIGQDLFPVRVRIAQGHNERLVDNDEADYLLATAWYSNLDSDEAVSRSSAYGVTVLSSEDTPKRIYHRTTTSGLESILKSGIVPGAKKSGRAHGYFSSYRLNDARYQSGMRSNMPVEIAIDTFKAMGAGCEFFVTDSDGTLTRSTVPPDCIVSAVDTSKNDQPLYVAESTEATLTGEPAFRAKRDYEEAASSSSMAAPVAKAPVIKPTAAKPAPKPKKMPTNKMQVDEPADSEVPDATTDLDAATREGEPSAADVESDTTEAGEDDPYPLGSFPCTNCQATVAKGMLFCLRCKAPQSNETSKVTKKFFENKGLRLRLLATAAAGARKPVENLISADFRQLNASTKKRGQMSAEATVIRDAKDRVTRATKLNFSSVASRWTLDEQFQKRMMSEGRCYEDMHRFDFIAKACLPDPGRTEEQRVLRAGAHFSSSSQTIAPGKLVYYAHCEVEPLRTLRLTDDCCSVPIGFTYLGAFLPPRLYADIVMHTPDARRILTFDGEVSLTGRTNVEVREELKHILNDSLVSAETQAAHTERLAEQNRQVSTKHRSTPKASIPAAAPTYQGYTQAQWDEWNRSRQGRRYTQAEWDAWNRTRRY